MRFAITGSNGYIATQVAKTLSKNHNLIAMIREGSTNHNPELYESTIYTDGSLQSIQSGLPSAPKVDAIIHLAAYYTTKCDTESAAQLLADNVLFTSKLLSVCSNKNIIFLGTSTFSMFNEKHEFSPRSFYDYTKNAMSELAQTYDVKAGILFLSDTYGPDDWRSKVHNLIYTGKLSKLNSKGSQPMNLTHTEDIARAFEAIAIHMKENAINFSEYEIYYPENETTLEKLAKYLEVDVEFLGSSENYGIPPLTLPIPNYSPIHSVKDIKLVLSGEIK